MSIKPHLKAKRKKFQWDKRSFIRWRFAYLKQYGGMGIWATPVLPMKTNLRKEVTKLQAALNDARKLINKSTRYEK